MSLIETPWGPWEPLSPAEVVDVFEGLPVPWWLAGGYAIELAIGDAYRRHDDIDIAVLRRDQATARRHLTGWDCWAADPPGTLRPWPADELLPPGVHDIWVRDGGPWRFQLMLEESDGDDWLYRRNPRIRRPLTSTLIPDDGFSRLTPEIQLLYKSKSPRPKDHTDFTKALPHLTETQRTWLNEALTTEYGEHPWLNAL
ncbi:nucleotidyltransferase domain-containing protein [Streptosporangium soli]|nr:amino acid transporter [Streptosporangium sp. KLBMP 9127]